MATMTMNYTVLCVLDDGVGLPVTEWNGIYSAPEAGPLRRMFCCLVGIWSYDEQGRMMAVDDVVRTLYDCRLVTGTIPDDTYIMGLFRAAVPATPGIYACSSIVASPCPDLGALSDAGAVYVKAHKRFASNYYASISLHPAGLRILGLEHWPWQFMLSWFPRHQKARAAFKKLVPEFLSDSREYLFPKAPSPAGDSVEILQVGKEDDAVYVFVPRDREQDLLNWMFNESGVPHIQARTRSQSIAEWVEDGCDIRRLRLD